MTDKTAADIQRGIQARALLDNEFFKSCVDGLDAHYHAAWRAAKTVEAREDCHRYVCLVEKLLADLSSIATTGTIAQARIKELEGKKGIMSWPR